MFERLLLLWCFGVMTGFAICDVIHWFRWRRHLRNIGDLGRGLSRIATAQTLRERLGIRRK
jgi:hypothetical protein